MGVIELNQESFSEQELDDDNDVEMLQYDTGLTTE
jgi:hypothetical protein